VVRQRSAKPLFPSSNLGAASNIAKFCAEVAELADARDLKSLAPKERTGSIPVFGTSYYKGLNDLKNFSNFFIC
jgi:hypothetical protein